MEMNEASLDIVAKENIHHFKPGPIKKKLEANANAPRLKISSCGTCLRTPINHPNQYQHNKNLLNEMQHLPLGLKESHGTTRSEFADDQCHIQENFEVSIPVWMPKK